MQSEFKWRRFSSFCILHSALCVLLASAGCQALGIAAQMLPPPEEPAKYTGLAGQSVGIMIWADRGIRIDWPNMQLDLANALEKKLAAEKKAKSVVGATYNVQPASIVRYQHDHPEIDAQQITEIAPALGVSRLIYIEMDDFATRSDMSVDLYRGQAKATVRVIEVTNGVAKSGFEQANVEASYPPKAPREGVPTVGDVKTYNGTIDAFATSISHLFIAWTPEEH